VKKIILCLIVIALIIVFAGCSGKVRINLNAPSAPDSLNPATGATDAETTITLTWSVSVDPKGGTVRYDLYMGTTNTPERVAQDLTENTYQVSGLQNSTTYYWQVVAKNETGDSSKSALNSLTTKDVSGPSTGKYRGLTLGLTDYGNGDLSATDDDSDEIKITFENLTEGYTIQKQTGRVIKSQIINWLTAFVSGSQADDVFVFHYSGHGFYESGQSRMYLSDGSDMSMSELRTLLNNINGTKIVLIDACESGNFTDMTSGRILTEEELIQNRADFRRGILDAFEESNTTRGNYSSPHEYYVMTGSAINQYSNEDGYLNHGYFSFFFNDGMGNVGLLNPSGAYDSTFDADGYGPGGVQDGNLTHRELYNYSRDKVTDYMGSNEQTVQANHTDSDFVIGTYSPD
jgi:hypothetical protein